jgi:hypothetical protein
MAFVAGSGVVSGTDETTSSSLTLGTTQADDIIAYLVIHGGAGEPTIGGTFGETLTLKRTQTISSANITARLYWARATGDHSGQTITATGLTDTAASVAGLFRGRLATGDPFTGATIVGEDNASGDEGQAGITTTADGCDVVVIVGLQLNPSGSGITTFAATDPSTLAVRADHGSNGGGDCRLAFASAERATAGATGAFTWAHTNAAGGSFACAILPAAAAGPVLVGETSGSLAADATASPTLPGPPLEGDWVLVVCGTDAGLLTSAGTGIDTGQGYDYHLDEDLTENAMMVASKIMGSTPDTTVDLTAPQTPSTRRMAYAIQVWRGADPTTPMDVAPVLTENVSSGYPDAGSITPDTDGCLIFAIGTLDDIDEEGAVGEPSGYGDLLAKDTDEPTNPSTDGATVMIASKVLATAAAENPGAFTGTGSSSWEAVALALRTAAANPSPLTRSALTHSPLLRSRLLG